MKVKVGAPDLVLMGVTLALVAIGVVMVFSASSVTASLRFEDAYYFAKRQTLWLVPSLLALLVLTFVPFHHWQRLAVPAMGLAVVFLVLVLFAAEVKGSSRWLVVGPLRFSPAEMTKLCLVLFLARALSRDPTRLRSFFGGLAPYLLLVGLVCGLIMAQPDLGTTMVVGGTAMAMLMMAGASWWHLSGLLVAATGLVAAAIYYEPYRFNRFLAFLDPWKYPDTWGFQTIQSLYALGSGGWLGVGLGCSLQKYFYLPEQHTDFIFAILGEELGLVGCGTVIALFVVFAVRGFRVALRAPSLFGSLLAAGITCAVVLQAIINIGVVSGALPVTGIPLPFISYGGSSLLFTMAGVGLVLNVSRYRVVKDE
ncbi:MAG: putative lipid II flippase FtsW [Syntrophomonadaceae bacterium]|jgi:cell division protein FtsW|nr:putative lipid II flippase FtsW [Syntrophomonadaceae bacterium]MDH7497272.1 putative lipid II flippase FtsW [Syntrophomonadaceae bacterium]